MKKSFTSRKDVAKWMRRAAIISVVLLLISLGILIVAQTTPTEVEKETNLISYEHRGAFNYLAYLKPSYLFGPEPEEPEEPPPNPKYPTELIERIDMVFRYETSSELMQGVKIEAILENPDLWQKKIELVPVTDKTGNFKVEFELDLDEINELFNTIDAETDIRSNTRKVTLLATVGLGEGLLSESLIQELPIQLSRNILEIDSNRVETVLDDDGKVKNRGKFDYTIHLVEDNTLYDTETLTPPPVAPYIPPEQTTMVAGQAIPSALVDRMDASYNYRFSSDHPVRSLNEEVTITATIENPGVWSKTINLVPTTRKVGNFEINFPVRLNQLRGQLSSIIEETGISAETHNIIIRADVHVTAETDFGVIDETFSQTLTTDSNRNILEWDEALAISKDGAITTIDVVPNPNRYLGLSVERLRLVSIILVFFFIMCIVASVVFYNRFKPAEPSLMTKEVLQIGKKYGDRIAEASGMTPATGEKVISLGSIDDLVKVADELAKPVIHQPPSASEKRHAYYVLDGTTQYQYIITTRSKERRSHAGKSEWS